jgi:hypothetical protein
VSEPEVLLVRIQQRIAAGILPCADCVVTLYGSGRGRRCAACEHRILGSDGEIECDVPGGGTIYFHQACYEVWQSALAA